MPATVHPSAHPSTNVVENRQLVNDPFLSNEAREPLEILTSDPPSRFDPIVNTPTREFDAGNIEAFPNTWE